MYARIKLCCGRSAPDLDFGAFAELYGRNASRVHGDFERSGGLRGAEKREERGEGRAGMEDALTQEEM